MAGFNQISEWFLIATASVASSIMGKSLEERDSSYFYGVKAPEFYPSRRILEDSGNILQLHVYKYLSLL